MSRDARPGELRTRIRVLAPSYEPGPAGHRNPKYANIYPDGRILRCKWVSAFGAEAVTAHSLRISDLATLTLRHDPRITSECVIQRVDTGKLYEIISAPNDVADAHRWVELKVKGSAKAL